MATDRPLAADGTPVPAGDLEILRRLAARKREIAEDPLNLERRDLWYRHDAGTDGRPMVLAELGGVRDAHPPVPSTDLECRTDWARGLEHGLRRDIYQFEVLGDDHVVEPCARVNWHTEVSGYGVEIVEHHSDFGGTLGARRWDAPIQDLDRDFHLLQPRTWSVDRQATFDDVARLEAVFGDLLAVQIRGGFWWTLGMTWRAIELIGLEGLMMAMYDCPEGLHRVMAFLRDDHLAFARWLEAEGLLSLNNENDYIGSGSMGYTRDLPAPENGAESLVHTADQWVLLESQETVGVGPEMFAEFIFPYQHSLAGHFGKCYYGCCEPVHNRIHVLKQLPNLSRISVSPWADEEMMARECATDVVFSRKPNPTLISTEVFDEATILTDLRQTLRAAAGCRVELIMKDVHTLNNEPERLPRWVALARQAVEESLG